MSYLTTKEKTILGFSILGLVLFIALALAFPLITIWAINTLVYPVFSIPYSWSTYFAMLVINWILMGSHSWNAKKIIEKL